MIFFLYLGVLPIISLGYTGSIYITRYKPFRYTKIQICEAIKHIILSVQLYVILSSLVFTIHIILSSSFRSGLSSGPGMGDAFIIGFMIAIFWWVIMPVSFLLNVIVNFFIKYYSKKQEA